MLIVENSIAPCAIDRCASIPQRSSTIECYHIVQVKEQITIYLLCNIVSRDDDEEYDHLDDVLKMSENGQLFEQNGKAGNICVDAVKPYQLRYLTGLPASST